MKGKKDEPLGKISANDPDEEVTEQLLWPLLLPSPSLGPGLAFHASCSSRPNGVMD